MGALQINDELLMAYVDHKDDGNQGEWEWDPTPNEWQDGQRLFGQPLENLEDFFGNVQFWEQEFVRDKHEWGVEPTKYQLIKKDDPLDTFSLSHHFGHETRLSLDEINGQHRAMNMFGKEYNSDPSKFIVPDTEPRPIVYIPEEPEVLFFESFEMENGHLMESWTERETMGFFMGGEPIIDDENWESFQAGPLDGYSLHGLFQEPELVTKGEEMVEELHSFVPPMAFDESSRGPFEDSYHTGHEEYVAFNTNQFIQVLEGYKQEGGIEDVTPLDGITPPLLWKDDPAQPIIETVFEDADWFPQAYIIGESLP
ncbi:hypothetical protein RHGRI_016882 [Rhododendron griersonianum]|uniref:Uncharacterized protein n=1 Tax=Rhododendron griersonianum TaxID=479676 RepID=A0AAV6JVQ6_9ERIC|nr:hypothetical protein RHGRI_016882 [Rhododendron griersonianum]